MNILKRKKLRLKLISHLLKNGNKKTCENVLLKSFKNYLKIKISPTYKINRAKQV